MTSKIAWTNETWNPITGCSKVSDGCRYCYAERLALKYGWSLKPWTSQNVNDNIQLHEDRLLKPLSWKQGRMVFVNSMSDLFHENVPSDFIDRVFDTMRRCPQHIFQILTKRPERATEWSYPAHVWIGTSVEDKRVAGRIDGLRRVAASVRFISFEPLIGPVGPVDLTGFAWAIVGGESGPDHRPMDMAWARGIRDICTRDRVALFFKQDSSVQPGTRPYLVEENGSHTVYHQYPGDGIVLPVDEAPQQMALF